MFGIPLVAGLVNDELSVLPLVLLRSERLALSAKSGDAW